MNEGRLILEQNANMAKFLSSLKCSHGSGKTRSCSILHGLTLGPILVWVDGLTLDPILVY